MTKILIRLDDACDYMNLASWNKVEEILDKYKVKPLVGIIPHCEDAELIQCGYVVDFWKKADRWKNKGWSFALHGYNHVYITKCGGLNPINKRSEFAGVPLAKQQEKIRKGVSILNEHGLDVKIFFAPSHTYDENTLIALRSESQINIISDGIANNVYFKDSFFYLPQQVGHPIKLPVKFETICLHPNTMTVASMKDLDSFLRKNGKHCVSISEYRLEKRTYSIYDKSMNRCYFFLRSLRRKTDEQ